MTRLRKQAIFFATLCCFAAWFSQANVEASEPPWRKGGPSQAEDLVIELTTFGRGDPIVTWFGHSALIVKDTRLKRGRLYNFGMFDMDFEAIKDFAAGTFNFYITDEPIQPVYRAYRAAKRDVRIQRLNLPAKQKRKIAEKLVEVVKPENRYYRYDHYTDNCSTRIRDMLNEAVDGQLKEATSEPTDLTFRDHTRRLTGQSPGVELMLMYLENAHIDHPIQVWDELFLPAQLEKALSDFTYTGPDGNKQKIVASQRTYYDSPRKSPPERPPVHWPIFLLAGISIGAVGAYFWSTSGRLFRWGYGLYSVLAGFMLGFPGTCLFIMATMTWHDLTYWNENLFLASPLSMIPMYAGIKLLWNGETPENRDFHRKIWILLAGIALGYLPLKLLPWFYQDNLEPIAFILPVLVVMAAATFRTSRYWSEDE